MMSSMSMFVPREDVADRLSVSLTLILTAVAYKYVIIEMLPKISYMTLLDQYIAWCSLFLLGIAFENGFLPISIGNQHRYEVIIVASGLFTFVVMHLVFARRVYRILQDQKKFLGERTSMRFQRHQMRSTSIQKDPQALQMQETLREPSGANQSLEIVGATQM